MPFPCAPQGMFNDDAFGKMKKGARIVNVARGGVIDEAALARALDNGQVAQVTHLVQTPYPSGDPAAHPSTRLQLTLQGAEQARPPLLGGSCGELSQWFQSQDSKRF